MKYIVCTPPYERSSAGWYDPPTYGSDVAEVDAESPRQAKILGLRELRRKQSHWVDDQESDNRCPFNGLKVYLIAGEDRR